MKLLTAKEVAELSLSSRKRINECARAKTIPSIVFKGKRRFFEENKELLDWIEKRRDLIEYEKDLLKNLSPTLIVNSVRFPLKDGNTLGFRRFDKFRG